MKLIKPVKISTYLVVFALFAVLNSCSRVFEDDISDEVIRFISPLNEQTISTAEVTISWEEVTDAISYEVKLVSPDFNVDSPTLLFDGRVTDPFLTQSLEDGAYAVSVYAVNNSSETEPSSIEFTVLGSNTFSSQQVEVAVPEDGEYFGFEEVLIEWEEIEDAEYYTLQVHENNNGVEGSEVFLEISSELELEYTFTEGEYFLSIIAFDGTDVTVENTISFGVDVTAPSSPLVNSPNSQTFLDSQEITFDWTPGEDSLSFTTDSIFIYSLTTDELVFSEQVSSPYNLAAETLTADQYEWGIVTTDEAGNWAESNYLLLVINE